MVGPFTFLDHMGPADFPAGEGLDVLPHPHIGLSTVTYLFEGDILHRDSLGSRRHILPGEVNVMTAGRGIAHSERTGPETRTHGHRIHGLQSWLALPTEQEECAPAFAHHAAAALPEIDHKGVRLRLVMGGAYGARSPVELLSPAFYAEVFMPPGTSLDLPEGYAERALYLLDGQLRVGGETLAAPAFPVFAQGRVTLEAQTKAHLMLLGGEPLPEPRYMWWNFVSSSKDRLEEARRDWKAGKFGHIPGETEEFVPLPEYK